MSEGLLALDLSISQASVRSESPLAESPRAQSPEARLAALDLCSVSPLPRASSPVGGPNDEMLIVDVSAEASLGPQSEVSLGESYVDGPVGGSFDGPSFGESCIEGSFDGPCGNRGPFDRSFPGQSTLAPPQTRPHGHQQASHLTASSHTTCPTSSSAPAAKDASAKPLASSRALSTTSEAKSPLPRRRPKLNYSLSTLLASQRHSQARHGTQVTAAFASPWTRSSTRPST